MALSVSRLVNIIINLSPLGAAVRTFGVLMVAGDSNVITGLERKRDYTSIDGVAADFGSTTPEFLAAELYFAQSPPPKRLSIGRWLRTATAAILQGELLSTSAKALINFTAVTSGGFHVTIDGVVKSLTGLDFSAVLNLNGVATAITTALSGAGTCTWDGSKFNITSATSGIGVNASGTMTFTGQPANNDTVTVNGTVVTFVTGTPSGSQVKIGSTAADTATNLNTFLSASTDTGIAAATYAVASLVVTATFKTVGTAGNSFTLAESAANFTVSGATLTGGTEASSVSYATAPVSGTDVSTLLGLTSTLALPLVPGYAAEEPVDCAIALAAKDSNWYGLMFSASTFPTKVQSLLVSTFIEAQSSITRIYGVTITDSGVLSAEVTDDLASQQKDAGYRRSFCQYSENLYAVASYFGRAFSVDFAANNSTITLMYKQEPSVVPEDLTETQANVLQDKRCNVFASYTNDTAIVQYGVMSGSAFFDEIHGLDWLQNAVQTACYNLLYQSPTKIPQTDAGANQFVNAIGGVCAEAVANGLAAPGIWNAPGFGQLSQGQYLKLGYYIFAQPIALQSQSDRETRAAPPITVAIKLAGAIQSVDATINVNR